MIRDDIPVLVCDVTGCDRTFSLRPGERVMDARKRARAAAWRRRFERDACGHHAEASQAELNGTPVGPPQRPGVWSARSTVPLALPGVPVRAASDANTVILSGSPSPLCVVTGAVVTDTGGWFVLRRAFPAPARLGRVPSMAELRMVVLAASLLSAARSMILWTDSTEVAQAAPAWLRHGAPPWGSWMRGVRPLSPRGLPPLSVFWASRSSPQITAADALCRQALPFPTRPPKGHLAGWHPKRVPWSDFTIEKEYTL